MATYREPEGVDFVVEHGETDPKALQETTDFIRAYKNRPEYQAEAREADRILESIGINPKTSGIVDPEVLLEHWRRCVADLTGNKAAEVIGKSQPS